MELRDIPGGPVVKNLPSNARDAGSIPGQGTKIPHAAGQLSPRTTTTELACLNERDCIPQTTEPTCSGACVPQLERENPQATMKSPCTAMKKISRAATKTQRSQKNKENKQ